MAVHPTVSFTLGTTRYTYPLESFEHVYHLRGQNVYVVKELLGGFPVAVPTTGQANMQNYLHHHHWQQEAPLGFGLQYGNDDTRIYSMKNINAMFPRLICLGPLKQAATQTSPPSSQFAVARGFQETQGDLWMMVSGPGANDEPLWYLSGGNTWLNSTMNADVAGNANTCSGIVQIGNAYYAITRDAFLNGGNNRFTVTSTDKTTWSEDYTAVSNEGTGAMYFLEAIYNQSSAISELYSLRYTTNTSITLMKRTAGSTTSAWAALNAVITENASVIPRGLVKWHDSAGATDLFIGTSTGIWWFDVSANGLQKVWTFRNPISGYTGQLAVSFVDDAIYFVDGYDIGRIRWGPSGFETEYLGPASVDDPSVPWSGLPAVNVGYTAAIALSKTRPWVYAVFPGAGSAVNTSIAIYDIKAKRWRSSIYEQPTVNIGTFALYEFNDTLHFLEETGPGSTQAPQYFAQMTYNPENTSGYKFAASGVITLSRFNGFSNILSKAFYQFRAIGDLLTANETLSVKFATNGGALGTAQTITASPGSLWVDGSATAIGANALDVYAEITLARGGTNTLSPRIRSWSWEYDVVTPLLRSWKMRVGIRPRTGEYSPGGDIESAAGARAVLEKLASNTALIKMALGEDLPAGSEAKGRLEIDAQNWAVGDVRDQIDVPFDGPGWVDIRFHEVIA